MRHAALDIINDEHRALAAMLRSLSMLLAQARREARLPDFGVLRAMLFYIDEFPEKLHHRKESELLFPKLLHCCPELAPVIERLEREHERGEKSIRELEHALLAFELMGPSRRAGFEQAVERYISFYLQHMALEEDEILPAARRSLQAADWAELDAAFASHRDPLTGHPAAPEYQALFQTILMHTPAPIGLGAAS